MGNKSVEREQSRMMCLSSVEQYRSFVYRNMQVHSWKPADHRKQTKIIYNGEEQIKML